MGTFVCRILCKENNAMNKMHLFAFYKFGKFSLCEQGWSTIRWFTLNSGGGTACLRNQSIDSLAGQNQINESHLHVQRLFLATCECLSNLKNKGLSAEGCPRLITIWPQAGRGAMLSAVKHKSPAPPHRRGNGRKMLESADFTVVFRELIL
jgi:hypothetical protein